MKSRVQAVTIPLSAALVCSALVGVAALADSAPIPGMQTSSDNGSAFQQGQAPLPGSPSNSNFFQNLNEKTSAQAKAPVQTKQVPQKQIQASKNPATAPGGYSLLPITVDQAQSRIAELKEKLETNPPNTMQESIYVTCEWMQELANSHWKMYQVFDKNDSTKAQAKEEKALALEFSKLKNKAKLLKADLLIKQQRVPEAIDPLVEIVVAEPTSTAGQEAYKRLVDLGFSKSVASVSNAI
ncbi:MAG: hypothetical protein IPG59_18255 [Candidatus Melainabacteria bacterium]|nr:MAG: hypothetical protein IPG59_18255 [Candidatus Melainabacteria bacterium]